MRLPITRLMVGTGLLITALFFTGLGTGPMAGQGPASTAAAAPNPDDRGNNRNPYLTTMQIRINGKLLEGDPSSTGSGIETLSFEQSVITAREAGSGLATGRRQYQPLLVRKRIDKASPLLMRALTNNEAAEVEFKFYRPNPSGRGLPEHFYTVQLKQARVSGVRMVQEPGEGPTEEISLVFRTISWTYVNGGVTHEDTWDQQR